MAITYYDKKYTPNQFAKELLIDAMELKREFGKSLLTDTPPKLAKKK